MLLPLILYFCFAFALADETNKLLDQDSPQLISANYGHVPLQLYNRDNMGIERVLTVNPLQIDMTSQQQKKNLLPIDLNTDSFHKNVLVNVLTQDSKKLLEPAKLQYLLIAIKNFLEKQNSLHSHEDKSKATISLQYDIPTSHTCPHTLKVLDLINNAYRQIVQYCKLTGKCDANIISNINQISSLISKSDGISQLIPLSQRVRNNLEYLSMNGHNLRLLNPDDFNDNQVEASEDIRNFLQNVGSKSIIKKAQNSQNSYDINNPKHINTEKYEYDTNHEVLNVLQNRPKSNEPIVPDLTKNTASSEVNALSLQNILSAFKGQTRVNINQEYAKILSDKLHNMLLQKSKYLNNNESPNTDLKEDILQYPSVQTKDISKNNVLPMGIDLQQSASNYKNIPVVSSATAEVKLTQAPNIVKTAQNIKDSFYVNNPPIVDNANIINPYVSNYLVENQMNVKENSKVFRKPDANVDVGIKYPTVSDNQHLHNTYGIYEQLVKSNPLSNQANPELINILMSQQNADVRPNNIPIVDIKRENVAQLADLSRLLGVSNQAKLNSIPKHKGVVELTYMIKQPKPAYEPLYYVKYRMPSQQFYYNLQNILIQKPHLRSIPQELHEELLNGSNVAEVTGDLKGLNNDEIIKLISHNGTLVTAKVMENNEATADEQLKIIQDINANISLVNLENSNNSDNQRLQAIERLVNSTKSNILGGYLRSSSYPLSDVQHNTALKGYNINYPNTQQYANSQASSYYNMYKVNPLYYSTAYGSPGYKTLYKNVAVPVKVPNGYYPQNYYLRHLPNTYSRLG